MRRITSSIAATLALASCTLGPIETERTVPDEPAAVAARVEAELTKFGFRRSEGGADVIEATAGNVAEEWATCGPTLVGDGDNRRRMATAERESGMVRVVVMQLGDGASVTVSTRFAGYYRNSFIGYGGDRPCRSTGVL